MNMQELFNLPMWCIAACYQDNENKEHFRKVPYTWQGGQWRRGGYNMRSNLYTISELYEHVDTVQSGIEWVEAHDAINGKVDLHFAMVLINGLVCIDIDHAGDNPDSNPIVQDIIKQCNSYAELSYSGHGVHIYGHGNLPNGLTSMRLHPHPPDCPNMEIEIYTCSDKGNDRIDNARCMVYTDKGLTPINELNDLTSVCNDLYNRYGEEPAYNMPQYRRAQQGKVLTWDSTFIAHDIKHNAHMDALPLAQDELHERLRKQLKHSQAPGTLAYYWYNQVREEQPFDESSTDLSMLIQLAFTCNGNAADMLMLFGESPYYQAKDEVHLKKWQRQSYVSHTLGKAIERYHYLLGRRQ